MSEKNTQKKGKLLEEFILEIFSEIGGLTVIAKNSRLSAEEIDLIVQNHVGDWKDLGTPMIIECKNWDSKVGTDEISKLCATMEALSPDVKTSVLVCIKGITGNSYRDAQLRRRECRQKGRYILVLNEKDLKRITNGESLALITEEKYFELFMI